MSKRLVAGWHYNVRDSCPGGREMEVEEHSVISCIHAR